MRERIEVLECDEDGCDVQVSGTASRLAATARSAGWQVHEVLTVILSEDGPDARFTDRCPDHHAAVLSREEVLEQAGGPGGLQPHDLW